MTEAEFGAAWLAMARKEGHSMRHPQSNSALVEAGRIGLKKSHRRLLAEITAAPGQDRKFYGERMGQQPSSISKLASQLSRRGKITIERSFGQGFSRSTYYPVEDAA